MDIAQVRQSFPEVDHDGKPHPFPPASQAQMHADTLRPRSLNTAMLLNRDSYGSHMGSLPLTSSLAWSVSEQQPANSTHEERARKLSQKSFGATCSLVATRLKDACQKYAAGDSRLHLPAAFLESGTFQAPLRAIGKSLPVKLLRDRQSLTCGSASSDSQKMMADSGCSDVRAWLMAAPWKLQPQQLQRSCEYAAD